MPWKKIEGGQSADVWNFDNEKELEGEFLRKEENIGPNASNMYYFQVGEEEVAVWGNTVLDSRLGDLKAGTKTKIVYLGKQTSKRGNQFKNFDVFVDVEPVPF